LALDFQSDLLSFFLSPMLFCGSEGCFWYLSFCRLSAAFCVSEGLWRAGAVGVYEKRGASGIAVASLFFDFRLNARVHSN